MKKQLLRFLLVSAFIGGLFTCVGIGITACTNAVPEAEKPGEGESATPATNVPEQPKCVHTDTVLKCAKVIKVYDGDTITVNVPGVHPLLGAKIGIRVNGYDTAEIKGKTKCEKDMAKEAQEFVSAALMDKEVELYNIERGKYFRIVADVYVDGRNLKDVLLEKGLAYAYAGETKAKVNWCKPLKGQLAPKLLEFLPAPKLEIESLEPVQDQPKQEKGEEKKNHPVNHDGAQPA